MNWAGQTRRSSLSCGGKEKHKFVQKLRHLKSKNDILENPPITATLTEKPAAKSRRCFIKRQKYFRWKKQEAFKQNLGLVHNSSDFTVTPSMECLLNKGLGFAPTPKNVNLSQVQSELDGYDRKMRWKEWHFKQQSAASEDDSETDENGNNPNIFKVKKVNLPSDPPPPLLRYTTI